MKTILSILIVLFLALVAAPVYAADFSLQYLAAACPVSSNNAKVVETEFGPGVQHRDGKGAMWSSIARSILTTSIISFGSS